MEGDAGKGAKSPGPRPYGPLPTTEGTHLLRVGLRQLRAGQMPKYFQLCFCISYLLNMSHYVIYLYLYDEHESKHFPSDFLNWCGRKNVFNLVCK